MNYIPGFMSYMTQYSNITAPSSAKPDARFQPKRSNQIKNKRKKKKK